MTDEPIEGSAELAALVRLTDEITGLREDVKLERRGRRLSIVVMALAILVVSLVGNAWRIDAQRDARAACQTRSEGRTDTRAAIRRAVDVVAVYADLTAMERAELLDQVTVAIIEELPPPSC